MAKFQCFEELPVWQQATQLYSRVLDFLEESNLPVSTGFRHQLERAAFSVGYHIAEGYERFGSEERCHWVNGARGAATEIRSLMGLVKDRPKLQRYAAALQQIRTLADTCARQLAGWASAMDKRSAPESPASAPQEREPRETPPKGKDYRPNTTRSYRANQPPYSATEK